MNNTQNQRQILANKSDDVSKAQENQSNPFDTLSDEVHLEILKKVPQLKLDSLALVCHRFSRLIEDRSLWKDVMLYGLNPQHELERHFVVKLMRRQVQNLLLHNLRIPSASFRLAFEATQQSLSLKEVCFRTVQICPDDLAEIFNKCKQLRVVFLGDMSVNKAVFVALSGNKNLEILHLQCLSGLQPVSLEVILRNVEKLKEFFIDGDGVDIMTLNWTLLMNSICENLPPSLLGLIFGCCDSLTDGHIAHIVRRCPLLERLEMYEVINLTERSMELLQNLKDLRKLDMAMCHGIPPEAFLAVTKMENLLELDISGYWTSEQRRHIEELFGLTMIEADGFKRVSTIKTSLRVVKFTY